MRYLKFLWEKAYIGFLIVLLCACLGSIRGAVKERTEVHHDITEEDIAAMELPEGSAPDLVGVIPLAAKQYRWFSFSYAFYYGRRGIVIYCIMMAVYLPLYNVLPFVSLRRFLQINDDKNVNCN